MLSSSSSSLTKQQQQHPIWMLVQVTNVLVVVIFALTYLATTSSASSCIPTNDVRNSEGVCISSTGSDNSINHDTIVHDDIERIIKNSYDGTCPIWDFNNGLVLSGRAMKRNEIVAGLFPDIMISWKQHTARYFPRWKRHHYFFRNPIYPLTVTDQFIFAPAYKYPVQCHSTYFNLEVNYTNIFLSAFGSYTRSEEPTSASNVVTLNPFIRSDRAIAVGDPIYLPCNDPTLSIRKEYDTFPPQDHTVESLQDYGEYCYDMAGIYIKEKVATESASTDTQVQKKQYGTFASRLIEKGDSVSWGQAILVHRAELHDPNTGIDELLINYCYTPDTNNYTTNLLLLPIAPGANGMNHADHRNPNQTPNVEVMWMTNEFDPSKFFSSPTEVLFGDTEISSKERQPLMIEYVALRDIQEGEELLIDYGTAWQEAWEAHEKILQQQSNNDNAMISVFRQPIGLPKDMIPISWIEKESITKKISHREWMMPKLQVGELRGMQLSDGIADGKDSTVQDTRQITGMVDRIGLPHGLSEFMAKWADDMGITSILKSHVRGELQLPPEGERRIRLNGSTWWVKRFPVDWHSDMHYISPDDFASNQMFMNALADAGFDTVLNSVGTRDNLTSITVYYPSYIAVSHCTSSLMHNDSEEDGHYNIIFPVLQVNNSKPELIVGDEESKLYAPYKYEPDHAVVLGKNGLHGTAPCDYRGTDSIRMVVSVYMLDGDNVPTRKKVIREWENSDPPYPRVPDRENFIATTKHWMRNDPDRNLKNPLVAVSETVSSE